MTKFHYMQDETGRVFETANPEWHKTAIKLSKAKGKELHRQQTIERVKAMLEGVKTIYGIVRQVSASGMSRNIDLYVVKDGNMLYLTGYASTILDWPLAKSRGMIVKGCGMDMIFHTVDSLGYALGMRFESQIL